MKLNGNRWLLRISKSVVENNAENAVQALVHRFRTGNESLEDIARQNGVERIITEPLPFDGGVYNLNGERLIKLNSLAAPVRQRFTLAHEVGHLILENLLNTPPECTTDIHLERACDAIAVELLMPINEVTKLAREIGTQSPEKLGKVAKHFGVSLRTAAQRLYDLGIWKLSMGMWRYGPSPEQLWFVGKRPWKTDRPSFSVFGLAVESSAPVCTQERFSRGQYTELVALKAHHIGKNYVIAVVATNKKA
jgi:Zn-dependent peptidase ImmA (M78 family)